jgi:tRNA(fMet)-specific endonuclease VapC
MTGRYLFDTNIAIAIVEREINFQDRPEAQGFLNTIVLGELFFGVEKSSRIEENLKRLQHLRAVFPVLVCDNETARHYGIIRYALLRKGRPIPENDIWIAASARQHGLTLATRDGHFDYVDDLITEAW